MKYLGLIGSSIIVTLILLINGYYNIVTLDIEKLKAHVEEINFILDEYEDNKIYVLENNTEYVDRLNKIKSGIKKSNTSFFTKQYKTYKLSLIDNVINCIKDDNKSSTYMELVNKYNSLSHKEIKRLIKK